LRRFIIGPHRYQFRPIRLSERRLDMRMQHPPHSLVGLAENLPGLLDRHLPHQRQSKRFKLLREVLAPPLPRRCHAVDHAILFTLAARQRRHYHAFLVKHVKVPPTHRLHVVVACDMLPTLGGFLIPQLERFFDANHKRVLVRFVVRADHPPALAQPQQLIKQFFRCCHSGRRSNSASPLNSTEIVEEPDFPVRQKILLRRN